MACNFNIPFSGQAQDILQKAKSAVESQGGNFSGDETGGNFNVSVFGNTIVGSYQVQGSNLSIVISEKPFMVPCSMIESFLSKQLA